MDTWIDEGLSAAAEWIYSGDHPQDKLNSYNKNVSGLLDKGNNFFVWDNHEDNNYAVLDDYSTVYLFFQWLRIQAGSVDIYKDIIASEYYDYSAVTKAAYNIISTNYNNDWGKLLRDWLAANYINAVGGTYGYMNDPVLKDLKAHTVPSGTSILRLYPGEGVYSLINNEDMPANGNGSIKYAGLKLDKNSPEVDDSNTINNGALLTYNVETDVKKSDIQTDIIGTGSSASVGLSSAQGRFVSEPFGPFRISAGDMLRRNGVERNFPNGSVMRVVR